MKPFSVFRWFVATTAGVILAAVIVSWFAVYYALNQREEDRAALRLALTAQAKVSAQVVDSLLRMSDMALTSISETIVMRAFSDAYSPLHFHTTLKRQLSGLPQVRRLLVFDERGQAESDTMAYPPAFDRGIVATSLFTTHRDSWIDLLVTGGRHGLPLLDDKGLLVSRRVDDLDGVFRGVLLAEIPHGAIAETLGAAVEDSEALALLLTLEGKIIGVASDFRHPSVAPGMRVQDLPWLAGVAEHLDEPGTYQGLTTPHYAFAARRLPHFPLRVLVVVDEGARSAQWRSEVLIPALGVGAAVWALALGVVVLLYWQARRSHAAALALARTNAKNAQMVKALSRSNAEMARLAEVMAHHFQEPTRRLSTFAGRLLKTLPGLDADEDSKTSLMFIDREAERLRNLVSDVQLYLSADTARGPQSGNDVHEVVLEEVRRLAPRLEAVQGRVETASLLPKAPLDVSRLKQILGILFDNALTHAPLRNPLIVQVSGQTVGGLVRYRVEDNGPGVSPAYRERVFRLFERMQAAGRQAGVGSSTNTGIGLAIARRIVESKGGRIWIEDSPLGGAAFVFELPLEDA